MAHPRSTLDQLVLGSLGTQLGGDLLASDSSRAENADVNEEQRPVLQVEPALPLGVAKRSKASGAGVSASCTNAGGPQVAIVVSSRFTDGWRSRSKRPCEETLVMK